MFELQVDDCQTCLSLGERLWKVIPKEAGATQVERLRELELPIKHRKVLARAFARLLDECAGMQLLHLQHATLRGRDVVNPNVEITDILPCSSKATLICFCLLAY